MTIAVDITKYNDQSCRIETSARSNLLSEYKEIKCIVEIDTDIWSNQINIVWLNLDMEFSFYPKLVLYDTYQLWMFGIVTAMACFKLPVYECRCCIVVISSVIHLHTDFLAIKSDCAHSYPKCRPSKSNPYTCSKRIVSWLPQVNDRLNKTVYCRGNPLGYQRPG